MLVLGVGVIVLSIVAFLTTTIIAVGTKYELPWVRLSALRTQRNVGVTLFLRLTLLGPVVVVETTFPLIVSIVLTHMVAIMVSTATLTLLTHILVLLRLSFLFLLGLKELGPLFPCLGKAVFCMKSPFHTFSNSGW